MSIRRRVPLVDSTVPDVRGGSLATPLIQGQPTGEATSPLVSLPELQAAHTLRRTTGTPSLMVLASGRVLPAARTPFPSRTSRQDVGYPVGSRRVGLVPWPGPWPTRRTNVGYVRRGARTNSHRSPWRLANAVTRLALCPDVFNGRYSQARKGQGPPAGVEASAM